MYVILTTPVSTNVTLVLWTHFKGDKTDSEKVSEPVDGPTSGIHVSSASLPGLSKDKQPEKRALKVRAKERGQNGIGTYN